MKKSQEMPKLDLRGRVAVASPRDLFQTPRSKSPNTSRGSRKGSHGLPLGVRRERVWSTARERVASSQYTMVENQIRRAMDCGQDSALVCRLFYGKDYQWIGDRDEPPSGQLNPRRKALFAVDGSHADLHHSSYWELKEQWRPFVRWIESNGLVWDMCFIVETDPRAYNMPPIEAKYADIKVSWPPYMDGDTGRVRGQLLTYWEDKCVLKLELKGTSLAAAQAQWKNLVKGALNSGQPYCYLARLYHPRDFYAVRAEERESVHASLVSTHPARAAISNALLPESVSDETLWVLKPHLESLVNWVREQQLSWYLVFGVEADPTDKRSIAKAKVKKLRELYTRHANDHGVMELDDRDTFLVNAVDLMDTPVHYELSAWCLFTVTDLNI